MYRCRWLAGVNASQENNIDLNTHDVRCVFPHADSALTTPPTMMTSCRLHVQNIARRYM